VVDYSDQLVAHLIFLSSSSWVGHLAAFDGPRLQLFALPVVSLDLYRLDWHRCEALEGRLDGFSLQIQLPLWVPHRSQHPIGVPSL
jgi:hypothetical protein